MPERKDENPYMLYLNEYDDMLRWLEYHDPDKRSKAEIVRELIKREFELKQKELSITK